MKKYYVYILASKRNGTLYIGVTNDIVRRVFEHKKEVVLGFTKKYQVHQLFYYEIFPEVALAIKGEKTLKEWQRKWKINLMEQNNSQWLDLGYGFFWIDGYPPARE